MTCTALRTALDTGSDISPCPCIAKGDRMNAWTVCVSPAGVVEYLNKRINPTGKFRVVEFTTSSALYTLFSHVI